MSASPGLLAPSFQRPPSRVAICRAENYEVDLTEIIYDALREFDLRIEGKNVLLKPNLVGPDPDRIINTHPAVIWGAWQAFLRRGAASVRMADGPALERDTEAILESVRMRDYVGPLQSVFVDLNTDEVRRVPLRTRASSLRELFLPATVLGADLVVSMPKLKTHHWAGVSLSLKNMFGIVPGNCYGWPKNALHWAGIDESLLDLNATVRPHFAIVDGIVGMEGNGPIQGTPKECGVLVLGDDPVAVDATCARIMGIEPERVTYLRNASYLLGNIRKDRIWQVGEPLGRVQRPFDLLPEFQRLRPVHTASEALVEE